MKRSLLTILLVLVSVTVFAGNEFEDILIWIERSNPTLAAMRKLVEARIYDVKSENNLEDPQIDYDHLWGKPGSIGKTGELTVMQTFDFPTVYVDRARGARIRAEQYGYEYLVKRQEILLEAKQAIIEISALRRLRAVYKSALDNTKALAAVMEKRLEAGDANIIEVQKTRIELVAAKNRLQQAEIELEAMYIRLCGLNDGEGFKMEEMEFGLLPDLPLLEELLVKYEEASPEILTAVAETRAAENEIKLSRGGSMPRFGIGYKHEYSTGEKFHGLTVGMSIPVFANKNKVKKARAESLYARAELHAVRVEVLNAVEQEYSTAFRLKDAIGQYTELLDDVRTIDLLNKAFRAGQISIVEYYDELNLLFELRELLVVTERDFWLSYARLTVIDI